MPKEILLVSPPYPPEGRRATPPLGIASIAGSRAPAEALVEGAEVSYIDMLRTRISDIDKQLVDLDESFRSGKLTGEEYVEQHLRLSESRKGLEEELHRMGVTT